MTLSTTLTREQEARVREIVAEVLSAVDSDFNLPVPNTEVPAPDMPLQDDLQASRAPKQLPVTASGPQSHEGDQHDA